MKKLVKIALASVLSLSTLVGCGSSSQGASKTLKVFNWGEYVDRDVISGFENEFDCKVIYETFDSNETMYTKLLGGDKYDVMVPSEYMIERLIKEDLLQKIDWNVMTNKDSLDNSVLNQNFDKNNDYWVPYFYGNVGIVYDKTKVSESDLSAGWEVLRNTKYKGNIYMYDSERDSFMVALKVLGYSMNTSNHDELKKAYDWLVDQREIMHPVYAGDDVIDNMISGNKAMAVVYSGDGAYIMSENEDMDFFVPEQGSNVWYDSMVITKQCKDTKLANEFINFMLREDVAKQNTEYIGYDSAVKSVYEYFRDDEYEGISACAPDISNPLNETFKYQDTELKEFCAGLWTKVKSY